MSLADVFYLSGRKSGSARGGLIATNNKAVFRPPDDLAARLRGLLDLRRHVHQGDRGHGRRAGGNDADRKWRAAAPSSSSTSPTGCRSTASRWSRLAGGLACHVDARAFLPGIPPLHYPAEALNSALYLCSGARGVERGTMSEDRDRNGSELTARMELVRLAIPRRAFTIGHIEYVAERVAWLHRHRTSSGDSGSCRNRR